MNQLYERLVNKQEKLSLVGLGYVGMPIAVAFARKINVIGYDLNKRRRSHPRGRQRYDPQYDCGVHRGRNEAA